MKVLVLHTRLAPYYVACLRELVARGHEVEVVARPQDPNAPFDGSGFSMVYLRLTSFNVGENKRSNLRMSEDIGKI